MAEIGHKVRETLTVGRTFSATFVTMGTSPDHRIQGSELDANSEYILIARAGLGGSDSAVNDFQMHINENSVGSLAQSNARSESRRATAQTGLHYGFLDKFTTPATPNDYEVRGHSDGTAEMRCSGSWLMMMKLADLNADDWRYAADDTGDDTLTTTMEDGVSVNLSVGDWDIYGFARFEENSGSDTIKAQMSVDGVVKSVFIQQGEDTTGIRCLLMKTTVNVPSGTPAAKIQYGTAFGTAPDLLSTRIFAIRLDAFEDHAFKNKAKGVSETDITANGIRINVDTLTYTSSTAATRTWLVSAALTHDPGANQARLQSAIQNTSNVDFIGIVGSSGVDSPEAVSHGTGDETVSIIFGELTGHADATDLDLELDIRDNDSPGNGFIDESSISAFTWELAVTDRTVTCTTEALQLDENAAAVNRARTITALTEALSLNENAASVNRSRIAQGITEALQLNENAAAVNGSRIALGLTESLQLATNSASVNRSRIVLGVSEVLELNENAAAVNGSRIVQGLTEALQLNENAAAVNGSRITLGLTEALLLTTLSATVNRSRIALGLTEVLELAENAATVILGGPREVTCITEALQLSESAAAVNRSRIAVGLTEVLLLTATAASVNRSRIVVGLTEALLLDENAAAVSFPRLISALTEALELAVNSAAINRSRIILAATEALQLIEGQATVNRALVIAALTEALSLGTNSSVVNRTRTVAALTEDLELTESQATVTQSRSIAGLTEALLLSPNSALVNRLRNVTGIVEALQLSVNPGQVLRSRNVLALSEQLLLTPNKAAVLLADLPRFINYSHVKTKESALQTSTVIPVLDSRDGG